MTPFKITFRISSSMAEALDAFILRCWECRRLEITRSEIVRKAVKRKMILPTQNEFRSESAKSPSDPSPKGRLEIDVKVVIPRVFDSPLIGWIETHSHAQLRDAVREWLAENVSKVHPAPPPKASTLAEMAYLNSQREAFNRLCLSLGITPDGLEDEDD